MRKLRPEVVDALAESIAAIKQIEPIIVRPRDGGGYYGYLHVLCISLQRRRQ